MSVMNQRTSSCVLRHLPPHPLFVVPWFGRLFQVKLFETGVFGLVAVSVVLTTCFCFLLRPVSFHNFGFDVKVLSSSFASISESYLSIVISFLHIYIFFFFLFSSFPSVLFTFQQPSLPSILPALSVKE